MKTPIIIGLTGYAGTGKDTVRAILEEHNFIGLAFADPIRAGIRAILGSGRISDVYMDNRDFKESVIPALGVSYRHMAQTLGTEWGRGLNTDFWLRLAGAYMADIEDLAEGRPISFVVSDVRFSNEAAWVRERGGVIWHIQRSAATPVRAHISESEVGSITSDLTIYNNGTLDELRYAVEQAVLKVLP